ncbi:GL16628, partial [Drosophila persimilis]
EQPEATTDAAAGIFNDIEGVGKTGIRKSDVKSALGQKLLEAIGLPQNSDLPPESSRDTVRSALKRSLKKAQEQQQQLKRVKQEEPVKQLADSTTKPSASESAEEHKKAIAERELALLKRRSKVSEERKPSLKDEKSERTDVSSSSSRNRRNRKSKTDVLVEDSADEEKKPERWDEDDDLPLKTEGEKALERSGSSSSSRPARTSKTMSKYYKGPSGDKTLSSLKSQHSMGTRSTRQR